MTVTEEETENEEDGELILSTAENISYILFVFLGTVSAYLGIHFSSNVTPSYFHAMPTFKIPQHLHGMGPQLINLS